jgi:excisionase family DNA binding protein
MTHELLTVPEACDLLRLSPRTLYALAQGRKIPGARRIGQQWRFSRAALLAAFHKEGGRGNGATERKTAGQRT